MVRGQAVLIASLRGEVSINRSALSPMARRYREMTLFLKGVRPAGFLLPRLCDVGYMGGMCVGGGRECRLKHVVEGYDTDSFV